MIPLISSFRISRVKIEFGYNSHMKDDQTFVVEAGGKNTLFSDSQDYQES